MPQPGQFTVGDRVWVPNISMAGKIEKFSAYGALVQYDYQEGEGWVAWGNFKHESEIPPAPVDPPLPVSRTKMLRAYESAKVWAAESASPSSRANYAGVRDTLAVLLGITTQRPTTTGPGTDIAAHLLL